MSTKEVKGTALATAYFTLQGIGTLISWNGVLNGLDYFNEKFPDGDVFTLLPIAFNSAQVFANFFLPKLLTKLSLENRIIIPLIVSACILIGLPIEANVLQGTSVGFWLMMFLLFIMGNLNCIYQGSVSGFASSFPFKYTSYFLMGTGIAGVVMNVLRALAIVSFSNMRGGPLIEIIVYFGAAGLILIGCVLIHPMFIKSAFCKAYTGRNANVEPLMPNSAGSQDQTVELIIRQGEPEKLAINFATIMKVFGETKFYVLLLFLNYAISFTTFPGIMQEKPVPSLSSNWKLVSMLTTFNVFDVVGKNLAQHRKMYTKWIILGIVFSRFIYDALFILQAIPTSVAVFNTAWFGFLNIALFGLTNGFATTALFIMGPEAVDGPKKEIAGFLSVFGLVTGLTAGGLCALPINKYIVNAN
jgi:equilibrative nucleoside transporter 1/2/3